MADDQGEKQDCFSKPYSGYIKLQYFIIFCICITCGALNSYHQYSMFENDRHFSHLSELEREMSFRTEMGLYYSYYKTLVSAPSYFKGLELLIRNNLTEYPNVINTLQRFNLYPEIVLAAGYRMLTTVAETLKINIIECWSVNRDDLPPIISCEGLGDPANFYVTHVFMWNGLVGSVLFLYGLVLSNSILGGILTVLCFFYNHGESTRVQWTPPLRESFGYPLCLAEMLAVTLTIKYPSYTKLWSSLIAFLTAAFLLSWQFAQFPLLTQILALFVIFLSGAFPASTLRTILHGQMIGVTGAFIFLFGNSLLLVSFYVSTLVVVYGLSFNETRFRCRNKIFALIPQLILLVLLVFLLKNALGRIFSVDDDQHIWNLLRSKFSNYSDFHTLLYTCAAEFNFLEKSTVVQLSRTLLLPSASFCTISATIIILWNYETNAKKYAEVLYNILQMLAFATMALLVMRLKLFFTPHLCIVTSLLLNNKLFKFLSKKGLTVGLAIVLAAMMSVQGVENLQQQMNIVGEYSNPQLEEVLIWVNKTTPPDAVFAGPMPAMANLLLSTRRPIVNHPHYENSELRERNLRVYSLFSRRLPEEVYKSLKEMGVQYALIDTHWCFGRNRPGCSLVEIWDVQEPKNKGKESVCEKIMKTPSPFQIAFRNQQYTILKLQKSL